MNNVAERLGASLRRAPYVWLALTILLYLMMSSPVAAIVTPPRDANTPIAIAAAAVIAYAVIASVVLVPRHVIPKLQSQRSENQIALLRWTLATSPNVVGIFAVSVGGQSWAFVLGSLASMALTIHIARDINAHRGPDASRGDAGASPRALD